MLALADVIVRWSDGEVALTGWGWLLALAIIASWSRS